MKQSAAANPITILRAIFFSLFVSLLFSSGVVAQSAPDVPLVCVNTEARKHLADGYAQQSASNSEAALLLYEKCLAIEPSCVSCLYEEGWSFWRLGRWADVVRVWEAAFQLDPNHPKIPQFMTAAKENLGIVANRASVEVYRSRTKIFSESEPKEAPISMTLIGRRQSYNAHPENPLDRFDSNVYSPKSVNISPDGLRAFVNALEGGKTVVYDTATLDPVGFVDHTFTAANKTLFAGTPQTAFGYTFPKRLKQPLVFVGKPVEAVFSHKGRYLWVPYYRRSFDEFSNLPAALALIDAKSLTVLRVFPTGPIAKYVEISPDGHWLAISHWGDNTVGLYDIRGDDPKKFRPAHLLVVEKKLILKDEKVNRDKVCGYCLRGLAFTADSQHLVVGRMAKGGFAIFNLRNEKKPSYLGSVLGVNPGPRDVHIDPSGEFLYASDNANGTIIKVRVKRLLEALAGKAGKNVTVVATELGVQSVFAGLSVRTIKFSPDFTSVFAAVNQSSEVLAINTAEMKVVSRIPVDSYPVGLAVSPDGGHLWVTSQGREARGGNSVGIYAIRYRNREQIATGNLTGNAMGAKNSSPTSAP